MSRRLAAEMPAALERPGKPIPAHGGLGSAIDHLAHAIKAAE